MSLHEHSSQEVKLLIESLLTALKERDLYTYSHSQRVAQVARRLAQIAGLNEEHQEIVEYAAMFHDIGKIGIPDPILLKPSRLTLEEQNTMRLHPLKGLKIIQPLSPIPFFKAILAGITCHHERIDGLGYPFGLKGDEIPIDARIILIADTFDAMTTDRPYRKALPTETAFEELQKHAGTQFDRELVKVFINDIGIEPLKKAA